MKTEHYLSVTLLGVFILVIGFLGLMKNSHKTNKEIVKQVERDDYSTQSISFICNRCGKVHSITTSGNPQDYIILPCNGDRIEKAQNNNK